MKNLLLFVLVTLFITSCTSNDSFITGDSDQGAISGQYKTMTIVGDYMYAVNNTELITIDLTDKANPKEIDKQDVGTEIENIYQDGPALFIGSRSNLHIYSLESNGIPLAKSDTPYLELAEEITICDPVVANKQIAYVTLSTDAWRTVNGCSSIIEVNELRSYNVADLENPTLVNTYDMNSPKGMSIDGNFLFVSDGNEFKVFEMNHEGALDHIGSYEAESYDLIAKDRKLLVVSKDEIRQYDYSDINDIKLYSTLDLN